MYKDLALITNTQEIAQTTTFPAISLTEDSRLFIKTYGYVQQIQVTTPAAGAFTANTNDVLTRVGHGLVTGAVVRVSTTGTLPAPLVAATDYFVIRIDADNFYLATTLINANAGTRIDITTTGSGVQTVTPTALTGASFQKQVSVDGVTWINSGSSTNITVSTNIFTTTVNPAYNYMRHIYTIGAGELLITERVLLKGN